MGITTLSLRHIVVLGLLCSGFAVAADEAHWNLEQVKQRLMLEMEETEVRINQMRIEAMEHEALAKRLQAEAARLELQMRREIQGRKRQLELAAAEVEVHGLLREAEHLESRGHHDKAHELRAKAEGIEKMVHARRSAGEGGEERDLHRTEREIDELRERSGIAEREGRIEEAKQLWERADRLAGEIHRHHEPHERHEHMDRMHGRMRDLGRAIEEAEREGRERAVDELREEAEALEREMHEHGRATEHEHLEQEIHRLHQGAERAEERGRGDEADRLRREAKELEHRLDDTADANREEEEHEDESLRDELNELREQMADMRRLIEDLRERLR